MGINFHLGFCCTLRAVAESVMTLYYKRCSALCKHNSCTFRIGLTVLSSVNITYFTVL